MSENTDKRDRSVHSNGRHIGGVAIVGDGIAQPAVQNAAQECLDAVCRSVTRLVTAGATPPVRLRLRHSDTMVEIEWPDPGFAGAAELPAGTAETRPAATAQDERLRYVCAPSIGTFYHSSAPGAEPFVAVGDVVSPGMSIGILEVMKMMSPVTADHAGRIVEVLVPDAHPVEFGERLLALEPVDAGEDGSS